MKIYRIFEFFIAILCIWICVATLYVVAEGAKCVREKDGGKLIYAPSEREVSGATWEEGQ